MVNRISLYFTGFTSDLQRYVCRLYKVLGTLIVRIPRYSPVIPPLFPYIILNDSHIISLYYPQWFPHFFSIIPSAFPLFSHYSWTIPPLFPNNSPIIPEWFLHYSRMNPPLFLNESPIIPKWFPHYSRMIPPLKPEWIPHYSRKIPPLFSHYSILIPTTVIHPHPLHHTPITQVSHSSHTHHHTSSHR